MKSAEIKTTEIFCIPFEVKTSKFTPAEITRYMVPVYMTDKDFWATFGDHHYDRSRFFGFVVM